MVTLSDPLVSVSSLLPLCDTTGGGVVPTTHRPGPVRPWCARLAVIPLQAGRHDTTPSRWTEQKVTQESKDGTVVPDSVPEIKTDT